MEVYLYQVAQNYSDLVELSVEGQTEEGRPIYLLKIGGEDDGPLTSPSATAAIFIDAGTNLSSSAVIAALLLAAQQLLLHSNHLIIPLHYLVTR